MIQNKIFTPRNIKLLKKTSPAFSTIPQSPFQAGQQNENQKNKTDPSIRFKDMRIFRNHTSGSLFNLLSCNKMVQKEWLVKNSEKLYLKSISILGGGLVNTVIEKTVGKVYTGGNTLKNIPSIYNNLKEKNVNLIINYCDEAPLGERCESDMDKSTQFFIASIRNAQEVNSNIGVKYSGICDMDTMKSLNVEKRRLNQIFTDLNPSRNLQTIISGKQIFNKLNEMGINCTQQEFLQFATEILKQAQISNINDVKVSRVQWESLVHPYYIEQYQNENPLMQKLVKFTPQDITKINNIVRRLNSIYEVANEKPSSRIYVDAEQSFVQYFIESISTQYQLKYNHTEPMIYSTIQCYLKDAQDKLYVELEKEKEFGIKLGLKFVKGAYLSEELKLADANNLQDSYETTGECYVQCAKIALDNLSLENEILFGIHNVQNVEEIEQYMQEQNIDKSKVDFAQLLGMADFITYSLADKGYRTSKYVPFGETDIMIPYLCRRAYEGFKFMTTSKLQESLIKDEIKKRFFFKK